MYISVPRLNADYLANMSIDVLANYFSIPLDRDEEIATGIYVSKPVRSLMLRYLWMQNLSVSSTYINRGRCDRLPR
jgi:hypothetical protein